MRNLLSKIQLKTTISNFGKLKAGQFTAWEHIQKIALILNEQHQINKNAIDKFISKNKKYFDVFYIETNSKAPTYADWQCIVKPDLNLLKLPKSTLLQNLHKKQFDLVLNACDEDDRIAIAITASLKANFKCAPYESYNQTNLVIKKNATFNLIDYLEEVVRYLKMIKN